MTSSDPEKPVATHIGCKICCEGDANSKDYMLQYHCLGCGQFLCAKCVKGSKSLVALSSKKEDGRLSIKGCKFCAEISARTDNWNKNFNKVHPRDSPEPPSPCFSSLEKIDGLMNIESVQRDSLTRFLEPEEQVYSPHDSSMTNFSAHPSPVSVQCSPNRCGSDEEVDGSGKHFFGTSSESCRDISDIHTHSFSFSFRHHFCSSKSVGSTPSDRPSRSPFTLNRGRNSVQHGQVDSPVSCESCSFSREETTAIVKWPVAGTEDMEGTDYCSDESLIFRTQYDKFHKSLDFENNDLIWFPPPANDEKDEMEGNYFVYDDDEDDYVGDRRTFFTPSSSLSCIISGKDRQNEDNKESLRAVVQGHFRALVSQLLYGEGIKMGQENGYEEWIDIITSIAWQAANFVKPDTSTGGSMDPCDYVKVKCVASGSPNESALVKGVVCTKNVKHKRMTSQYKNPRVLILGGALEYQTVPNQLASFDMLLQQETDHLKMIISKIEALHPNVLLVEKSVSSYAQEYLLAKEISLILNVKRPLLERISRCTGAPITPSVDSIPTARLGYCELFRLERVSEEHEVDNQSSRKPSKTLMYFEGCPRRLGCTVLLRGTCREELKKVKHVLLFAVFAAYHLSLETCFLADEGATLPKFPLIAPISSVEKTASHNLISIVSISAGQSIPQGVPDGYSTKDSEIIDPRLASYVSDAYDGDIVLTDVIDSKDLDVLSSSPTQIPSHPELVEAMGGDGGNVVSREYFSSTDTNQSILVSFSSHCMLKRIVCERSRLFRIKFYGCFDKPLGRYLHADLFDQTSYCRSCKEPADAHVLCYTHRQGNLTVNVKRIPSLRLPGEKDGKIWMWHRCLKCAHDANGVPPATRRVVMSDAAWGLSFGKFLELSFSNHATANRVALCGHSLQRDCLRYYGFGDMVAFFRFSPIDILSVCLPPLMLGFNGHVQQEWLRKEAGELVDKMEAMYLEISGELDSIEQKSAIFGKEFIVNRELHNCILELKDLLKKERTKYNDMLEPVLADSSQLGCITVDILELNRLHQSLLIASQLWDRRLYSLDLLLETNSPKSKRGTALSNELKGLIISPQSPIYVLSLASSFVSGSWLENKEDLYFEGEMLSESIASSDIPNLSERIDSAWTGSDHVSVGGCRVGESLGPMCGNDSLPPFRRLMAPLRVHSFDSALKIPERIQKGVPPSSLHLSTIRSFHASGDYQKMVKDPVSKMTMTNSQMLHQDAQKLSLPMISSGAHLALGVHLLVPHAGNDIVIAVYDDEPTSIISYALSSKEHEDWISIKSDEHGNDWNGMDSNRENISAASSFASLHSFGAIDIDHVSSYGNYASEDATSSSVSSLSQDPKRSPHLGISFGDESPSSGGRVKFSVTCYFGKQFESLRRKCCPSELDFVRSLSRCRRWSAQGGKSNVYFAKSMDERFIIKQVTKTELESFEDFSSEYFKYLNDSLSSGSPTCLAKILGLYQVTVKHLKGGKETKMDLMVMENLFFKRSISRVYDLKGSNRARYNPDTTGKDKVLLDMNLLETLCTKPIFLGSKAKRNLVRAIWNDTSFLASIDVMDYSLLVGVDDESKELVVGIIDFMRQYTWDKHLETWVKASGILGGPRNASPTIISPKQYKKRFRKAMTAYFLTVPDQWSS